MADKDALYLKGLKEGDRIVFEQLFREFYPLLCTCARRYTADKSMAEEVVQDFFCKLWDKHEDIQVNTSIFSYLRKSVINHCLNHTRKIEIERKFVNVDDDMEETHGTSDYDSNDELNQYVTRALLELPEKRREIFELSRFEGLKYHEIAERLNLSVKTVETQIARSLEFMRNYLKEFITVIALIINVLTKW